MSLLKRGIPCDFARAWFRKDSQAAGQSCTLCVFAAPTRKHRTLSPMTTPLPQPPDPASLPSGEVPPVGVSSSPVLAGERVAFTGILASMTHRQAQEQVEAHGGVATEHVSRQTTMLVIGEEGWPLEEDGRPSLKVQQTERCQAAGAEIRIVRESEFLGFVGLTDQRDEMHRRYTPAMLSEQLHLPVNVIRSWERCGLIRPVARVFRLPYFDFQEVSNARRLAELLAAGVPVRELQSGLNRLREVLGEIDRPLAQLEILARGKQVVYRDASGHLVAVSGQKLFDFDRIDAAEETPADDRETVSLPMDEPEATAEFSAEEWFEEGCRLNEAGHLSAAVEAFRMSLIDDPTNAETHFLLAETLYRQDNLAGALERYHVAIELDHQYLEAWTQLGCVHAQLGDWEAAAAAFRVALDVHADYPDAHFHLAEALCQMGQQPSAIEHWQRYLEYDRRGPWAASARKRLEESAGNEAAASMPS